MKTTIKFNKALEMTKQEIADLNALPENMPDIKLTAKQIQFVRDLYFKYIGRNVDNQAWGMPVYRIEMQEKWPSGSRMKEHQAQRIALDALEVINNKKKIRGNAAASFFHSLISSRESWQKIARYAFTFNG